MPDIRSFRGVRYNPQKIKDIAQVVTEPYDVISPLEQRAYYKTHPYNIIRLILGKQYSTDNSKNNQYARAAKYFADWQKRDILLCDEKEGIYIYAQSFPYNNKRRTRTGFIVLLKLEDFAKSTILPHENTNSRAVQERLELLKTVRANTSPIFAMFVDEEGKINKLLSQYKRDHRSYIAVKKDRVLHRIWRMSDKRKVRTVQGLLEGRQIFIADGHHRYEAALNYKMQMQRKKKPSRKLTSFNYVMTYLVATADPGLAILPTHRVIRIKTPFKLQELIKNLSKIFQVHKFSTSEQLSSYMSARRTGRIFGAYFGKNKFYGLRLKDAKAGYKFIDKDKQNLPKDLDVTILHSVVIEGIGSLVPSQEHIYYTRDGQEAIRLVEKGKYQAAFFLRPSTVTQVKRVAKSGKKMPHKSTYFYPKLLTGLVINKL